MVCCNTYLVIMIIVYRFTILHTPVFLVFLSRYCMHEWTVYPLHTVVVNLSSNIFCYNTECSSFSIVFLFSIGIILVRHSYFWLSSIFDISLLLQQLKTNQFLQKYCFYDCIIRKTKIIPSVLLKIYEKIMFILFL